MGNKLITPWNVDDGENLDEDDEFILEEMAIEDEKDEWV